MTGHTSLDEPEAKIPSDITSSIGPVTRARLMRSLYIYLAVFCLGAIPLFLDSSAALKAAGLGLWLPGGGFLAAGGWAAWIGIPLSLAFFAAAVFLWFGAAMVIAPPIVWLLSAAIASMVTGEQISTLSPYVLLAIIIAIAAIRYVGNKKRIAAGEKMRQHRDATLPEALAAAKEAAAEVPIAGTRELSEEDLNAARYAFDRALQAIDCWNGYDNIEEFQVAARRYQINQLAYTLGTIQCHYTPSFHGYLSQAQRQLIERYLQREIWNYWTYETRWGHLNFTNMDPAGKDNIMLTGFLAQQINIYTANTGDRRYEQPGSLTFRLNDKVVFEHDAHSITQSILDNFNQSDFCLYPCEPNWIYPICNHGGLAGLVSHDNAFGTKMVDSILDRWLHSLRTEFTGPDGQVIGLRSSYTGLEFKFVGGEAGYALQVNGALPVRAWRQWATARSDLQHILTDDAEGNSRVTFPVVMFDAGNYRMNNGLAYAGIANSAREFGDNELAEAALRSLDQDSGRTLENGVLSFSKVSNMGNLFAVQARTRRRDDWRNTLAHGPAKSVFDGPLLTECSYPEVLVAKAFSDGKDLQLVLYPGVKKGLQVIGLERLQPGQTYVLTINDNDKQQLVADSDGKHSLSVELDGRTSLHFVPVQESSHD